MLTLAFKIGFTVVVMLFDVAGLPVKQIAVELEVITTVMASLFAKVVVV